MKWHNQENPEFYGLPYSPTGHHSKGNLSFEQKLRCDDEDRRSIQKFYIPANLKAKDFTGTTKVEKTKQEFERLFKEWFNDTAHLSIVRQQISHLSFLKIIGMGETALPFIFREFKKIPMLALLIALESIVRRDDIAADAKTHKDAAKAWINWGVENGFIEDDNQQRSANR